MTGWHGSLSCHERLGGEALQRPFLHDVVSRCCCLGCAADALELRDLARELSDGLVVLARLLVALVVVVL